MATRVFILFMIFSNITNAQLSFDDVASQIGVDYSYGDSEFGGGVSFADFDNDGWDDLTFASEEGSEIYFFKNNDGCLLYTSPSPRDRTRSRMPSSA